MGTSDCTAKKLWILPLNLGRSRPWPPVGPDPGGHVPAPLAGGGDAKRRRGCACWWGSPFQGEARLAPTGGTRPFLGEARLAPTGGTRPFRARHASPLPVELALFLGE